MNEAFWLNIIIQTSFLWLLQYVTGNMVFYKDIKVGYTRKINHFGLFFFPIYLNTILPYEQTIEGIIVKGILVLLALVIYIKPLRDNVPLITRMFLSFDRPEDRPHTLMWLSTQVAVAYMIIVPVVILFSFKGIENLILIPILITGIGDGLAEPVGIRFGKHKYKTHALFSHKKYERSYEGSLCVFIVSVITIIMFQPYFSDVEFIVALITVPLIMTLTEAFSPHTWDTPTLFFVGYLNLYLIKSIPLMN